MNMPLEEFAQVTCANGHSRRFVQIRNGWMRRLQQDSPGEIDKVSPWMPDESGKGQTDGVYCRFCDAEVDLTDHTNAFISLIDDDEDEERRWSKRRFNVCDGVLSPSNYSEIHSDIISGLHKLDSTYFGLNLSFVTRCNSQVWEEIDEVTPMKFDQERAGDVITILADLITQMVPLIDEGSWKKFLKLQREEFVPEIADDFTLLEFYDVMETVEHILDVFDGLASGQLDINDFIVDDLDFGEEAA